MHVSPAVLTQDLEQLQSTSLHQCKLNDNFYDHIQTYTQDSIISHTIIIDNNMIQQSEENLTYFINK